jgi:hypothetical protein
MKTDQNQILQEWGVHVSNNMLQLPKTRVLPAPMLRFGAGVGVSLKLISLLALY